MLVLVPPSRPTVPELEDFRQEFVDRGEKIYGCTRFLRYTDVSAWLKDKPWKIYRDNFQFFSFDTERELCVGCIRISLQFNGGGAINHGYNFGASIRPTERGRGYGKQQLYLAIQFMKDFGEGPCLPATDRTNIASIRNITTCGGEWLFDQDDVSVFKIEI